MSFRGLHSTDELLEMFRDSFPGASEARLNREFLRPNRRVAQIVSGTVGQHGQSEPVQVSLKDRMVDLFELWMVAVAAELGVTIHFVDTWFYHLRDGQVHCGTNVLRHPVRSGTTRSYDLPDHPFRGQSFEFEEGERIRAGA
jgi:hypothetical protein